MQSSTNSLQSKSTIWSQLAMSSGAFRSISLRASRIVQTEPSVSWSTGTMVTLLLRREAGGQFGLTFEMALACQQHDVEVR